MQFDPKQKLKVESDSGTGRPFLILFEEGDSSQLQRSLASSLAERTRVVLVEAPRISDDGWEDLTSQLTALLQERSVRQASFVTFGACCALVQALALRELKTVRTIVFVDASTRAHPTTITRFIDRIENALPLGLPLRLEDRGFDAKPFLQRIRCPVLVVTSSRATAYQLAEAEVLEAGLPTAWRVSTSGAEELEFLTKSVMDFQEVPAKCPQKRAG